MAGMSSCQGQSIQLLGAGRHGDIEKYSSLPLIGTPLPNNSVFIRGGLWREGGLKAFILLDAK